MTLTLLPLSSPPPPPPPLYHLPLPHPCRTASILLLLFSAFLMEHCSLSFTPFTRVTHSGRLAPLSARPCTACKANICGRRYENDSSGEEPDRSWMENERSLKEGGRGGSSCQMCRSLSCNALKEQPAPLSLGLVWFVFLFSWLCVCVTPPPPLRPFALTSSACRPPCLSSADTRYTVEDIEGALLKQMKASKDTGIGVKKPEEQNIRFTNYGNSARRLSGGESCRGLAAK